MARDICRELKEPPSGPRLRSARHGINMATNRPLVKPSRAILPRDRWIPMYPANWIDWYPAVRVGNPGREVSGMEFLSADAEKTGAPSPNALGDGGSDRFVDDFQVGTIPALGS